MTVPDAIDELFETFRQSVWCFSYDSTVEYDGTSILFNRRHHFPRPLADAISFVCHNATELGLLLSDGNWHIEAVEEKLDELSRAVEIMGEALSDLPPDPRESQAERLDARRSEGTRKPPITLNPLDAGSIATALLEKGHTLEAAFVRHFAWRQSSTWQDIVEAVSPGEERSWATVKTWVNRVKKALADVDPRCRLSFKTSRREYRIVKNVLPE
jgi:hypothetical protein